MYSDPNSILEIVMRMLAGRTRMRGFSLCGFKDYTVVDYPYLRKNEPPFIPGNFTSVRVMSNSIV